MDPNLRLEKQKAAIKKKLLSGEKLHEIASVRKVAKLIYEIYDGNSSRWVQGRFCTGKRNTEGPAWCVLGVLYGLRLLDIITSEELQTFVVDLPCMASEWNDSFKSFREFNLALETLAETGTI